MGAYDVNGGSLLGCYGILGDLLNTAYDIYGNPLEDEPEVIFADEATTTDVYISASTSQPQGGCIDDDKNVYICLADDKKFLKYNIDTGIETQTSIVPSIGHGNGMTYNPYTECFYVAAMTNDGTVRVFDKSLNWVNTLYATDENGTPFICWNIAYDRRHRKFITIYNRKMFFMDDNFNYVKHVACAEAEAWPNTAQDLETDGNYVYCIGSWGSTIGVLSMNGTFIKLIPLAFSSEPESMCYDWVNNDYYVEGKSGTCVIRQTEFIET